MKNENDPKFRKVYIVVILHKIKIYKMFLKLSVKDRLKIFVLIEGLNKAVLVSLVRFLLLAVGSKRARFQKKNKKQKAEDDMQGRKFTKSGDKLWGTIQEEYSQRHIQF